MSLNYNSKHFHKKLQKIAFSNTKSTRRLGNLLLVWSGGLALGTVAAVVSGNEKFYREVVMPATHRLLEPETAHRLAIWTLARIPSWLTPRPVETSVKLSTEAFGRQFPHPIGLAAGFDKDAEAVDGLLRFGFSFVEIGSVTPQPQSGNARPRVFRLIEDSAIINRYGFNSCGHDQAFENLSKSEWMTSSAAGSKTGWVGVNLGANKTSLNPVEDYASGAAKFAPIADYLVVNVSSPNTAGLRDLQRRKHLEGLLAAVIKAANDSMRKNGNKRRPPVLLKISPDCSEEELSDICSVALAGGVDGLIVSNTTVSRPASILSSSASESGGLSGRPLAPLSTRAIAAVYKYTAGRLPIIGVGGISNGADALEKLEAGASLLQVYTVLAYEGPPVLAKINRQLEQLLVAKGYNSVKDAVGAGHRKSK